MVLLAMLLLMLRLHRALRRARAAERQALAEAVALRELVANSVDMIMRVDLDGVRRYVSPASLHILGFTPQELIGNSWDVAVHPDDRAVIRDVLVQLREGEDQLKASYRCIRKDGAEVWLDARIRLVRDAVTGAPAELVATARDVSWEQRYEEELMLLVGTDGLTGVANRRLFDERFQNEWRRAQRSGTELALLMLDADHFKLYNDCYGHVGGDAVLRSIAECIGEAVSRSSDFIARYGGEEFAVLLPGVDLAGAIQVAERIRLAVMARRLPHARSLHGVVTVSLGVASLPVRGGLPSSTLIHRADQALYEAKRAGRNVVLGFHEPVAELAAD